MFLLLQDEELLGHVQSAILQVQGDCEKLNITTSNLIEDHQQKQKDINVRAWQGAGPGRRGRGRGGWGGRGGRGQPHPPPLPLLPCSLLAAPSASQVLYQGLEKLEKEKANREHLEMEIDVVRKGQAWRSHPVTQGSFAGHSQKDPEWRGVRGWEVDSSGECGAPPWLPPTWGASSSLSEQKADKSALASKVSRIQFDATTEQLNHMMRELVAKMSGQERDWQKMLDKLLVEMDSKVRGGETRQGPLDGDKATCLLRPHPGRPPSHPPAAGPPGAGAGEEAAGGPVEVLAAAAQRALPTLPGG